MIESYIESGNQKIGGNHIYGKSITDPCLDGKIQRSFCIRLQKCADIFSLML